MNVGKTTKFILAKDLGAKVTEKRQNRSKKNSLFTTAKIRKSNRKDKESYLRKTPGSHSFLTEVFDHIDTKVKAGNVKVIPELAKI